MELNEISVKLISADQTIDLRHRILRPNQERIQCHYAQDLAVTTFHIGAFLDEELVGVASFHQELFAALKAKNPYRLRGMATEAGFQGKGIGKRVLSRGVEELKMRGCDLLWCNARAVAFPFYERMGLKYHGEFFDLPQIGPHKVMYRHL